MTYFQGHWPQAGSDSGQSSITASRLDIGGSLEITSGIYVLSSGYWIGDAGKSLESFFGLAENRCFT